LDTKPLAGRRILVTRPREHAAPLARLIEEAGGTPVLFPAIEIEDVPCAVLERLAQYDLAVFVSPTAAQRALARVTAWPASLAVAAVGAGTRRALENHGMKNVLAPEGGADSEALLALLREVRGKKIVIVRGEGGREVLAETLKARGAAVDYAECYRRMRPGSKLKEGEPVDAITVSSAEALDNLLDMLGERSRTLPWFVPHPRVAAHAAARGLGEVVLAAPSDGEMLERLVAYFGPP